MPPFHCALRAYPEPNNLAIIWPTTQNNNAISRTFLFWWDAGFPRTAFLRQLWGIPDDLTARCLSNLLIVEPVVLISPLHHKTKTDHPVGLCFGGSGWIVIPTAINCGVPLSLRADALVPNQTI